MQILDIKIIFQPPSHMYIYYKIMEHEYMMVYKHIKYKIHKYGENILNAKNTFDLVKRMGGERVGG